MMSFELVANGVVAVLLVATIGFALVLNRRLLAMKEDQAVMGRLISGLNLATAKAQEGIYELRSVAQSTEESLKAKIVEARALADELQMMTEAGNNLAKKIERGLTARTADMPAPRLARVRTGTEIGKTGAGAGIGAGLHKPQSRWTLEEEKTDDLGNALRAVR